MPEFWITIFDQLKESKVAVLILAGAGMFLVIGGLAALSHYYTLNGIKSKTVGDGQHGTARWATEKEIRQTYAHVPFRVKEWRKGQNLPAEQGLVLGCKGKKGELTALVDSDDIHCVMIGASGIGKTAFFLYPNLEYACASGMSWLALDSKGDLARNYGTIAKECYGYNVSVVDLRNPTRSDGNNLLTLVNRYMDIARKEPENLAARAKAVYAKIQMEVVVMRKRQKKRVWTPEQKSEIVHKHLDEHISVRTLEREYTADRNMICRWVKEYIAEGESAFVPQRHPGTPFAALYVSKNPSELKQLRFMVAKLEIETERLKKLLVGYFLTIWHINAVNKLASVLRQGNTPIRNQEKNM